MDSRTRDKITQVRNLVNNYGWTLHKACKRIGVSKGYYMNALKILQNEEQFKKALDDVRKEKEEQKANPQTLFDILPTLNEAINNGMEAPEITFNEELDITIDDEPTESAESEKTPEIDLSVLNDEQRSEYDRNVTLCNGLRKLRQSKNLKACDVAKSVGLSKTGYISIENGINRWDGVNTKMITTRLGVTEQDLIEYASKDMQINERTGRKPPEVNVYLRLIHKRSKDLYYERKRNEAIGNNIIVSEPIKEEEPTPVVNNNDEVINNLKKKLDELQQKYDMDMKSISGNRTKALIDLEKTLSDLEMMKTVNNSLVYENNRLKAEIEKLKSNSDQPSISVNTDVEIKRLREQLDIKDKIIAKLVA